MSGESSSGVRIGDREIGPGRTPFVIGEVAQAHDGSLGLAHAFIDAIADAGADAVKFQTHIAAAESTSAEPFRVRFSAQDATRFDYWRRMEFSEDGWRGLAGHAGERGLVFLSSPFSNEAVELLERIGMPAWKVGSGEVGNERLLRRVASTGKPVILSTGLSKLAEVDRAVQLVRDQGSPVAVLQCTSRYPCPPEDVGLNLLSELLERYGAPVGLSDHSGTIYASLAAAALGVSLVEVHVTLSRRMFGPDVPASVTTDELARLTEGVRFVHRALGSPVDKDVAASDLEPMREIFGRSVAPRTDLAAGTELTEELLTLKKPGGGLPAERIPTLVGRRLRRDVASHELLAEEDLA